MPDAGISINRVLRRLAACVLMLGSAAPASAQLANCTPDDFSSVPIRFDVAFATEIQPIFQARCANCHISNSSGGLSLAPAGALSNLVNVPSVNANAGMPRVTPGNPLQSFLFRKVNCTNLNAIAGTPFGLRMPRNATTITLAQQALLFDWIAAGALAAPGTPEIISRLGFETGR